MGLQRTAAIALLGVYLAAHLALLPRTLEDLDSINFALGVRTFDVARHQPHPPGYPVFIGAAKLSTSALRAAGIGAASSRGLAIWSAIAGAAALPGLLLFFRGLEQRRRLALWATVVTASAPLYWFTGLRPLSDMLGFAAAIWSLALLGVAARPFFGPPSRQGAPGSAGGAGAGDTRTRPERAREWHAGRSLVYGGLIAGLAIGIRSQSAVLTLPLFAVALFVCRDARVRIGALAAFALGVIVWGTALIAATGGVAAYLRALGSQAGEDFSGVSMLWTHHTPLARMTALALANTFVWPWDWWLGIAVCGLALAGGARIAWRAPRVLGMILVAFGPYAVFHLLFQETVTTRYALPLLPAISYAAMAAIEGLPGGALPAAAGIVSATSLLLALPASAIYARDGAPVFRAFDDMAAMAHGGDRVDLIAMHAELRRAAEWAAPILPARVARAAHGKEWLTLVELWKAQPQARVWFAADPDRTDLALFDPRARDLARAYRWGFVEPPFVGGARPDNVDWYHMDAPNWMLDRGWSVTAEVGGVTALDHVTPEVAPAVAWVKRQTGETTVLVGGRDLAAPGAGTATLGLSLNGRALAAYTLAPGFFLRRLTLPAGALEAATPYLPLAFRADGPVSLEQFDAQAPGVPMFGYDTGWQEPEYNPTEGRSWRWMSEHAELWVRPVGRAVTLRARGESPRRYYAGAPHVRVLIGGREVATLDPTTDFDLSATLPADLLDQAKGQVVFESSRFFVPGGAGGRGDQRHLALRIYAVSVQ